ncbi:RING finger and CHY zinc finger domain-containing protein 1-like, partial [Trifolium medium]
MGEVAVLHSEPLHFECNDTKHMIEEDAYPPKSNPESFPGEESNANITVEDAESGPPVAMRFLIAAIVTMRR